MESAGRWMLAQDKHMEMGSSASGAQDFVRSVHRLSFENWKISIPNMIYRLIS